MMFYGDGQSGVGWLIAICVLLTVVAVAAWVVWELGRRDRGRSSPEKLLAERFARGEIDADEYSRRRDVLS
jgi:putative membrane protein